jgi:hypothetical protein
MEGSVRYVQSLKCNESSEEATVCVFLIVKSDNNRYCYQSTNLFSSLKKFICRFEAP